tara:strand:+ start:56 stop:274 length:219 start_codon:yes stop_codon:yes gene_type:complete
MDTKVKAHSFYFIATGRCQLSANRPLSEMRILRVSGLMSTVYYDFFSVFVKQPLSHHKTTYRPLLLAFLINT